MNIIRILPLLVLALSSQQNVLSQDNSALMAQIESSIAKQEPKWKLLRRSRTRKGDYRGLDWKSGKSSVVVFVAFYGSTEDAANHFKGLPGFFEENGLKMTVLSTTIPNLGDENYTWKDCCEKRFTGVDFRKGKVVVHVNAPSIEIAQRFASHIAEVITANTFVTARRPKPDRAGSWLPVTVSLLRTDEQRRRPSGNTDVGDVPLTVLYGVVMLRLQDVTGSPFFKRNRDHPIMSLRVRTANGHVVSEGDVPSSAIDDDTSSIGIALPEGQWNVEVAVAKRSVKWHKLPKSLNVRASGNLGVTLRMPSCKQGSAELRSGKHRSA